MLERQGSLSFASNISSAYDRDEAQRRQQHLLKKGREKKAQQIALLTKMTFEVAMRMVVDQEQESSSAVSESALGA